MAAGTERRAPALVCATVRAPAPRDLLDDLADAPGLALLETTTDAPGGGRFSLLAWGPRAWLECDAGGARAVTAAGVRRRRDDPFALVDEALRDRGPTAAGPVPFSSGLIGYLGYDLRHHVERLPRPPRPHVGAPWMWFGWYDGALVWDHADGTVHAVGRDRRGARFVDRISRALARGTSLARAWPDVDNLPVPFSAACPAPAPLEPLDAADLPAGATTSLPRARYVAAVERTRAHIRDGDCYVLNLSQQIHLSRTRPPVEAYCALARAAPVPYAALLATGGGALVAASPERFCSRRGDVVEARPIKGTCARRADPVADRAAAADLAASVKERAELTMIVDLTRNDLGRVAVPGGVTVDAPRDIESFATVHQAVATVRARLRPDATIGDLLRATFPAGSVTGCPKVRALELIDALEPVERGPYTGAYGWIDQSGDCDLAMTIRTALLRGGGAAIGAGGGLTIESDPEAEWEEAVLKARAVAAAVAG